MNGGLSGRFSRRPTTRVVPPDDPLRALLLIETVSAPEPYTIAVVPQCSGTAITAEEAMAARVKWATRARYAVLTRDVPAEFAPYNAIIRVLGTEDRRTDYLATLVPPEKAPGDPAEGSEQVES